ncbi:AraC family transcriptional regulator [Listeria floridensis FSL S10-1187]|uniref:AraC family transcriptional regulator n=1 Tax=Listeria floridensis FSL S10-1187 TaxID=1265817 RepID=A0ABP3AUQ8_9LIST|nr:AraC family transcriptional regulator [Listeria floridensis]EUJ26360.1 AraC family transcriptional regulator [Listeria floridensis FSL S10-1187]
MAFLESMNRAIEYMEDNLMEELSIEWIAKEAAASSYHFQRSFYMLTGITVAEYIRRRRLSLAAQDLLITDEKIITLAYKYGYETPEAFTKAFKRLYGITPSGARKAGTSLKAYNRLHIEVSLKGEEPMEFRIERKPAFTVIGEKRVFSTKNGENLRELPKFWEELYASGKLEAIEAMTIAPENCSLGICFMTEEQYKKGEMDYWIAAESTGEVPEGYETMTVPDAQYAIFTATGALPDAIQAVWKKIYAEWFPSSGYESTGGPELEVYFGGDSDAADYRSEVWIPIK